MNHVSQTPANNFGWRTAAVLTGLVLLPLLFPALALAAPPQNFDLAKAALRQQVYHDQNQDGALGTLYCGCKWEWAGSSGGRIDQASCGYEVRAQPTRANRIEWEHIVPAWWIGNQRQCWQEGGRQNCVSNDPVFRVIEADMHNLTPTVGEVNADRSNYRFGMLPQAEHRHGACDFKVEFSDKVAEPRAEVKGLVARVYFYMHDRYDLRMSNQQERLMIAWDRTYPVGEWERARDQRIAAVMGHSNPFVTGERTWERGHRNSGEGFVAVAGQPAQSRLASANEALRVIGNRNSAIYHLPVGCTGYSQVAERNRVYFDTEEEAAAAGFRRAGNCRDQPAVRQEVSYRASERLIAGRLLNFVETGAGLSVRIAFPVSRKIPELAAWNGLSAFQQQASLLMPLESEATDI